MVCRKGPSRHFLHRGAGLIEVMVAVLVFSIGLVGMVRLQIGAMRNAESAYASNKAALLGYAMLDALRADRAAAAAGNYDMAKNCTTSSGKSGLAQATIDDWLQAIKQDLGNHSGSCGEIDCDGSACRVRIHWDDSRAAGGSSDTSIEIRTQL